MHPKAVFLSLSVIIDYYSILLYFIPLKHICEVINYGKSTCR
jgi:hypothetical protein